MRNSKIVNPTKSSLRIKIEKRKGERITQNQSPMMNSLRVATWMSRIVPQERLCKVNLSKNKNIKQSHKTMIQIRITIVT